MTLRKTFKSIPVGEEAAKHKGKRNESSRVHLAFRRKGMAMKLRKCCDTEIVQSLSTKLKLIFCDQIEARYEKPTSLGCGSWFDFDKWGRELADFVYNNGKSKITICPDNKLAHCLVYKKLRNESEEGKAPPLNLKEMYLSEYWQYRLKHMILSLARRTRSGVEDFQVEDYISNAWLVLLKKTKKEGNNFFAYHNPHKGKFSTFLKIFLKCRSVDIFQLRKSWFGFSPAEVDELPDEDTSCDGMRQESQAVATEMIEKAVAILTKIAPKTYRKLSEGGGSGSSDRALTVPLKKIALEANRYQACSAKLPGNTINIVLPPEVVARRYVESVLQGRSKNEIQELLGLSKHKRVKLQKKLHSVMSRGI